MFDVNDLVNEDLALDEVEEIYEDQNSPIPEDYYELEIDDIYDLAVNKDSTGKARPQLTVHFKIASGPLAGRRIPFQRLDGMGIVTLLKVLERPVPKTVVGLVDSFKELLNEKVVFKAKNFWTAWSTPARDAALVELTGAESVATAKALAGKEHWKEANRAGNLAKSQKDFPEGEVTILCPVTQEPVEMRYNVRNFRK